MFKINIVIIILIVLILILITVNFLISKTAQKYEPSPVPFSTITPTQTPQINEFKVIDVQPKQDLAVKYNIITNIKFTFSDELDPSGLEIQVNPKTKIFLKFETPRILTIHPEDWWQIGITTITIKKAQSVNSTTLKTPYEYQFEVVLPENPPPGNYSL